MILKDIKLYNLLKLSLVIAQNVNQNRSVSTFISALGAILVQFGLLSQFYQGFTGSRIILIKNSKNLKHRHLAGAFFLALKSSNSSLSFEY